MQKGVDTFTRAFYRMLCSGSNVRESFLINYTNAKAEDVAIISPKAKGVEGPTLSHRNHAIRLAGRTASIWIEAEPVAFCSARINVARVGVLQHSGLNPWTQFHAKGVWCRLSFGREIRKEILAKKYVRSTA